MNLFDYIKYQGIDVTSNEEVASLPFELFSICYMNLLSSISDEPLRDDLSSIDILLKQYSKLELIDDYTSSNSHNKLGAKELFQRTLKAYCEEHREPV